MRPTIRTGRPGRAKIVSKSTLRTRVPAMNSTRRRFSPLSNLCITAAWLAGSLVGCTGSGVTSARSPSGMSPANIAKNQHSSLSHTLSEAAICLSWDRGSSDFANARMYLFDDGCTLKKSWHVSTVVHQSVGAIPRRRVEVLLAAASVIEFDDFPEGLVIAEGTWPLEMLSINDKTVTFSSGPNTMRTDLLLRNIGQSPLNVIRLLQVNALATRISDAVAFSVVTVNG